MVNTHPQDIQAAVRKKGTTLSAMSVEHGLHRNVLGQALKIRQPRYNHIIAAYLETTVHALWPEWFHEDGTSRKLGMNPVRSVKVAA
jgi:Ner family transcriptional regulator